MWPWSAPSIHGWTIPPSSKDWNSPSQNLRSWNFAQLEVAFRIFPPPAMKPSVHGPKKALTRNVFKYTAGYQAQIPPVQSAMREYGSIAQATNPSSAAAHAHCCMRGWDYNSWVAPPRNLRPIWRKPGTFMTFIALRRKPSQTFSSSCPTNLQRPHRNDNNGWLHNMASIRFLTH